MKTIKTFITISLITLPVVTFAAFTNTKALIQSVGDIVDLLIIIVAALALLAFFWGLAKFIFRIGGDEKAVESGRTLMQWGLIALFVMISVWGLVRFIQKELGLSSYVDQGSVNLKNIIPK